MPHQFLYIVDPLASLSVKSDTTLAILEEATSRGVKNFACELKDIFLKDATVHFMAAPVELFPGYEKPPAYRASPTAMSADDFNVIFMRKDPPVNDAFLSAVLMLRCHDPKKTTVINDPNGLLVANEKLFGLKVAPQCFPETLVSSNRSVIENFASVCGRVVLKPLFGAGGSGVLVFDSDDRNLSSACELLTHAFTMPIMVQSYIKDVRLGDKRIVVLGGKAIGAITRMPQQSDHRANFHAGGYPERTEISDRELAIVETLRPHLGAYGLHLVGIDVIGGYLTEINVTSPTCVLEIEQMSQKAGEQPLRAQIVDYVLKLIA